MYGCIFALTPNQKLGTCEFDVTACKSDIKRFLYCFDLIVCKYYSVVLSLSSNNYRILGL